MTNKQTRDEITAQVAKEIDFATKYKRGKVGNWQKNENMYYGKKMPTDESRANVELGRMQEFVHTLLSKIDNPVSFKFVKRKNSDYLKALRLNSLKTIDQDRDNWDIKDLAGKKQAILYGRSIFKYQAKSENGYKPCLENVDVYDFLIDPQAGGLDIEKAYYLGSYGYHKTKEDIKLGMKEGIYLKYEAQNIINAPSDGGEWNQQTMDKQNREQAAQGTTNRYRDFVINDKYTFWEWFTTYDGERYYVVYHQPTRSAIRVEKLSEITDSNMYPYWTYALFPDLTEFWTPSACDYIREVLLAQNISINQLLDNAEQINKPQRFVDVGAIDNLADLVYKRNGWIRLKNGSNPNSAVKIVETPQLNAPIEVFNMLENIHSKASGVNDLAKGVEDVDGRAAIYEGNQQNTADRYGLYQKSYSNGYKRFGNLYYWGVKEHLTKKQAVEIMGADGVTVEEITRKDIMPRGNRDFSILVESSNAETLASTLNQKNKLTFLQTQAGNPLMNEKKRFEIQAKIAGFDDSEVRQLLDKEGYGDDRLMADCDRDIEMILEGKTPRPNLDANIAYLQRIQDYMKQNFEYVTLDQMSMLEMYMKALEPIVQRNMASSLLQQMMPQQQEMPQSKVGNTKAVETIDPNLQGVMAEQPI
jgi:hypothetical protein